MGALLTSQKTLDEFKSIGCNNRVLERIFLFGGYSPSNKGCTNQLYSLKFSSQPCKISKHKCNFTETTIINSIKSQQSSQPTATTNDSDTKTMAVEFNVDKMDNGINKSSNNRLCNVTPMRVTRRSRLQQQPQNMSTMKQPQNKQQTQNNNDSLISDSLLNQSMLPSTTKKKSSSNRRHARSKRVSIVQTPVRAKGSNVSTNKIEIYPMFESLAATQKINGLDPELIETHQRFKGGENNTDIKPEYHKKGKHKHQKSVHWQFIERLLLNFDETLLEH